MIATVQPTPKNQQSNLLDSDNNNSSTLSYHCSHCAQAFKLEEDYKFHYKSDLHKYNLKRRILELVPVTEEQFNLWFNKDQSETSVYSNMLYCAPCGKQFTQKKTLNQHLQSKKHQEKMNMKNQNWREVQHLKDSESDTSASKIIDKRLSNEDPTVCLFCDQRSNSVNINKNHMEKKHGFFILQEQFLTNLKGLILEYGKLINEELTCIVCQVVFKSADRAKKHMIDKQHCHMNNLTPENSSIIFYDFNTNPNIIEVSEEEEEEKEVEKKKSMQFQTNENTSEAQNFMFEEKKNEGTELKENILEKSTDWEIYHAEHDIENSQSSRNLSKEERLELESKKKAEFLAYLDKIQQKVILHNSGEIELSNGKILGHRQYKKYYSMYYRDFEEYVKNQNLKMIGDSSNVDKIKLRSNCINLAIKAEAHNVEIEEEVDNAAHKLNFNTHKNAKKQQRQQYKQFNANVMTSTQVKAQQRKNQVL